MKIIDKKDLYVQKEDLIYLYETDKYMPASLQGYLKSALVNNQDFVKITDTVGIEYLFSSNIPTFDELIRMRTETLFLRIDYLLRQDFLPREDLENLTVKEILDEKRRRSYLLGQYREMLRFKDEWSSLDYPDVPFPYMIAVTNGEYNAQVTYNLDRIVILGANGEAVKECDDKEFCDNSFKELTHSFNGEQDVNIDMGYNGDYFVVKNKTNIRRRMLRPRQ